VNGPDNQPHDAPGVHLLTEDGQEVQPSQPYPRTYTYRSALTFVCWLMLVGSLLIGGSVLWTGMVAEMPFLIVFVVISVIAFLISFYVGGLFLFARITYDGRELDFRDWLGRKQIYDVSQLQPGDVKVSEQRRSNPRYLYQAATPQGIVKWNSMLNGGDELYQLLKGE